MGTMCTYCYGLSARLVHLPEPSFSTSEKTSDNHKSASHPMHFITPHPTCLYALEYDRDRPPLFVFLYLIYRSLHYYHLLQSDEKGTPAEAGADVDACLPTNFLLITRRTESPSTGLAGEMEGNCGLVETTRWSN